LRYKMVQLTGVREWLFILTSNPLSPYIFFLADRYKQLSNKEGDEDKEKIDQRPVAG
ncbi:hypothetical protein MKX03_006489, partial [Papaver bracteatum]